MSGLSSFIPFRPRRKVKSNTVKSTSPFTFKPVNTPTSPHPYASPEVFDIRDDQKRPSNDSYHRRDVPAIGQNDLVTTTSEPPPPTPESPTSDNDFRERSPSPEPIPTPRISTPPRMELELDTMTDWIPAHLLDSEAYASSAENGSPDIRSSMGGILSAGLRTDSSVHTEPGVVVEVKSVEDSLYQDDADLDDDYDSSTSEDIGAQMEALEASDFIRINGDQSERPERPARALPSLPEPVNALQAKKPNHIPSPIKIPNPVLHGPKVQIIRSSGKHASYGQVSTPSAQPSRPASVYSGEDVSASAISGTTLARALIGNSYVLSDERNSKYRSGGSVLTRADSATLPRGEHPYLSSPLSLSARERKISGPESSSFVPPVPANAEAVYIPPRNPRKPLPSSDSRHAPHPGSRHRTSTGSLLSPDDAELFGPARSASTSSTSPSHSESSYSDKSAIRPLPQITDLTRSSRRISHISEVTSVESASISGSKEQVTPSVTVSDAPNSASLYTPSPLALDANADSSRLQSPSSAPQASMNDHPRSALFSPWSPVSPADSSPDSRRESGLLSTAPSSASTSQFDNVLDYYQNESPVSEAARDVGSPNALHQNVTGFHFRPPFSPITEESSSQLSPPSPFTKRDAPKHPKDRMSTLSGKFVLTSSPSSPGGSIDWAGPRKDSPSKKLLPIGEISQPPSVPTTPSTGSPSRITGPSSSPVLPPMGPRLAPPHLIFNRQRSGSTPNPIRVARDSRDPNSYKITMGRPVSSGGSPPTTGESDEYTKQTFPETPNVFTPTWSAGSLISPGMPRFTLGERDSAEQIFPQTPMSAVGMGLMSGAAVAGSDGMPSLAQQLLTRAASSVQGVRSSRQPDITRARTIAYTHLVSVTEKPGESSKVAEEETEERKPRQPQPSWVTQHFSEFGSPSPNSSRFSFPHSEDAQSPIPPVPPLDRDSVNQTANPPFKLPSPEPQVTNAASSSSSSLLALPQLPPSPLGETPSPSPSPSPSPQIRPQIQSQPQPSGPVTDSPRIQFNIPFVPPPPPPPLPHQSIPALQTPTPATTPSGSTQNLTTLPTSRPLPATESSPHIPLRLPQRTLDVDIDHEALNDLPSPPPYYTLVFDQKDGGTDSQTPSSGGPSTGHSEYRISNAPSPRTTRNDQRTLSISSVRRMRNRPGVPLGPRRPSDQLNRSISGGAGTQHRHRNPSISSVNSTDPFGSRSRAPSTVLPSPNRPRFQTPPIKWRGYTMDAAKWTFTSSQLQAIVSRAIKQSAEASFVRLLKLDAVDVEIPNEMRKLEMQKTDIKSRYKMMSRRRAEILERLTGSLDGSIPEDSATCLRLVHKLGEMSTQLDLLAEELHSVDEQLAQLKSLCDVHNASALAMALRKLNTSFLKQLSISDGLRSRVDSLEAERDDAWKQAITVAVDYDHLSEKVDQPAESSSTSQGQANRSNRSSRVMAMRKSSVRVSRAGLRTSSRRSSTSSNRLSTATLSGTRSTYSVEDIPPVPPIPVARPRQRPIDIITDLRTSTTGLSTDVTPNSETRAMVQAHEELCDMLGIKMEIRPRRSRSVIEQPQERLSMSTNSSRPMSRNPNGRPLSMPDDSGLNEVYNVMTADRNAMLATLQMLSDSV
ncbi:hypothetical protein Moror_3050 [Moniliophthora roreri MCA 2997]|uniref:Uncharacterized protein n=1 Tax=Moniliophthora roreri (strain MCA 2997) TaxID=1381753 RepID=V2X4D2_MONRO|nr:hypothetical protein Moror_3050 [Moniliophthora roreri MCA 2997]